NSRQLSSEIRHHVWRITNHESPYHRSKAMRGILAVALLALGATGCGYNTIQTNDEAASAAKQQIEVQLQRRADLVGNLVETVKGQAQQELDVFLQVARARSGLTNAIQGGS